MTIQKERALNRSEEMLKKAQAKALERYRTQWHEHWMCSNQEYSEMNYKSRLEYAKSRAEFDTEFMKSFVSFYLDDVNKTLLENELLKYDLEMCKERVINLEKRK